jgi:hypothetical protein
MPESGGRPYGPVQYGINTNGGIMANDIEQLYKWFEKYQANELEFNGTCVSCGKDATTLVTMAPDGEMTIEAHGGAAYIQDSDPQSLLMKCKECFEKEPCLRNPCEVYTRIVGYYRPVKAWNNAKQAEFRMRKMFDPETEERRHDGH